MFILKARGWQQPPPFSTIGRISDAGKRLRRRVRQIDLPLLRPPHNTVKYIRVRYSIDRARPPVWTFLIMASLRPFRSRIVTTPTGTHLPRTLPPDQRARPDPFCGCRMACRVAARTIFTKACALLILDAKTSANLSIRPRQFASPSADTAASDLVHPRIQIGFRSSEFLDPAVA